MTRISFVTALTTLIGFATGVYAQDEVAAGDDEATLEEVVVTGSRVLGIEDSTSPVVTVGQAEFEENPSVTLADFLVENVTANNGQLTLVDESNAERTHPGRPVDRHQPLGPGRGKYADAAEWFAAGV